MQTLSYGHLEKRRVCHKRRAAGRRGSSLTSGAAFHSRSQPFPPTCDVVEVVETVEVQAAGLFVSGFWTLAPHAGRPQDVSRPHSTVGPGAGLETETAL